jgi:hypothetical protein
MECSVVARSPSSILLLTAVAGVVAVAGCSNPTGGTAALGSDTVVAAPLTSAGTGSPTAPSTADQPGSTQSSIATPAVTTLTVTTTAAPSTNPPAVPPAPIAPTLPSVPTTDLSGEVHGFVTAVDIAGRRITVDKVDWFTGAAAQQACAEDGITSTDDNRCTGYYYRNVNPMLRVVAVGPQATVTTLSPSGNPVGSDLATVAARVATTHGSGLYDFNVSGGAVTDLRELYFP